MTYIYVLDFSSVDIELISKQDHSSMA